MNLPTVCPEPSERAPQAWWEILRAQHLGSDSAEGGKAVFSPGVLSDHFPIPTPLTVKHLQVSRQVGLTRGWGAGVGVGG